MNIKCSYQMKQPCEDHDVIVASRLRRPSRAPTDVGHVTALNLSSHNYYRPSGPQRHNSLMTCR